MAITDCVEHDHEWMRTEQADLWLGFSLDTISGLFGRAGLTRHDRRPAVAGLPVAVRAHPPPPRVSVLGVGCGTVGGFVPALRSDGHEAVGSTRTHRRGRATTKAHRAVPVAAAIRSGRGLDVAVTIPSCSRKSVVEGCAIYPPRVYLCRSAGIQGGAVCAERHRVGGQQFRRPGTA